MSFFHKLQTTEEQGIDSYIGKTRVWTVIKAIFHMIEWPLKGPFLFLSVRTQKFDFIAFHFFKAHPSALKISP